MMWYIAVPCGVVQYYVADEVRVRPYQPIPLEYQVIMINANVLYCIMPLDLLLNHHHITLPLSWHS